MALYFGQDGGASHVPEKEKMWRTRFKTTDATCTSNAAGLIRQQGKITELNLSQKCLLRYWDKIQLNFENNGDKKVNMRRNGNKFRHKNKSG